MDLSEPDPLDFSGWDVSSIAHEIGLFQQYLATMEESLEAEIQKHTESLKRLIDSGQIQYDESGPDTNYDSHMLDLISSFEDTLRQSFFVSLYSFFEHTFLDECRSRGNGDKSVRIGLSDLAGQNDIDKAKTYITKVLQLDFPSNLQEWDEIQNYKTLRNCIVHARGRIDDMKASSDQKKLRAFIARKRALSIWERQGEIVFRKGLCEEVLETIENFLHAWLYP